MPLVANQLVFKQLQYKPQKMNISTLFWTIIIGICTLLFLGLSIAEPELMQSQTGYSDHIFGANFKMVEKENPLENKKISGLQITKISEGKLIAETEIKEGFIVTKLNGIKVQSINGLKKVLRKGNGEVVLEGIYHESEGELKYVFNL